MATFTQNYNLKKPDQQDFYNVEDFNNNADIIDEQLKEMANKADSALPASDYTAADILNKLKTVDGINSGLDADLFKGKSVIPVENGGTGANTQDKARENLNAFRRVAHYIPGSVEYDIDKEVFDSILIALSKTPGLNTIIGENFVYIQQIFHDNGSVSGNVTRYQIAHGYSTNKMASRHYYNDSWSDWKEIFTSESVIQIANGGTGATTASAARTNLGVAYGTTAGTVCQGNDSRPVSYTHLDVYKRQITYKTVWI